MALCYMYLGHMPILDELRYTRDLYPCYRTFVRHYPQYENDMKRAVEYALAPTPDPREIKAYLNGFGRWIVEAAEAWLVEHNPSRELELELAKYPEEVRIILPGRCAPWTSRYPW